ncbi:MAG: cysteine hydrolase [Leucobacter sp.]|nr:cysteine hydrolase [Leucobacter sp.]
MQSLQGAKTALLIVHMQNDIANPEGAFGGFFAEESKRNGTVEKVGSLIEIARAAGASVDYAVIGFEPGYPELVPNVPLLAMVKQFGAAVKGTTQTEVIAELSPRDGELVLAHSRTSPFQDSPLDRYYRSKGIETVIVCGIATNASVEDAARSAANLGYRTIIASDASSAATLAAHEATLESFGLFGEIATNDELQAAFAA